MIEAAYRLDLSTVEWLEQLAALSLRRPDAVSACAFVYRITEGDTVDVETSAVVGEHRELHDFFTSIPANLPPSYVRQTFARLPAAMAARSGDAAARAQTRAALATLYHSLGIRDIFVVNGLDPTRRGVYVNAMVSDESTLSRRQLATWTRVAAHLAAAYRLRRDRQPAEAEAIISPSGRIEHAEEPAKPALARRQLRDAALAIDRARTKRQRTDDFAAVEMWQALIAGRWTLVDRLDRDGRRFYIARQNDPRVARHHALSTRERQVLGYAVLGHSNTLIGYELGVSASTVANHLSAAAEKLGVRSRAALVQAAVLLGSRASSSRP